MYGPPEQPGQERQREAGQRRPAAVQAEQGDAAAGQGHPGQVAPAPGLHQRHEQRPDELDGDGHAQRHGPDREVEHRVHAGHGDAEQHGRLQRRPRPLPEPRPEHRQQEQARQPQPQQDDAGGAQLVEQGAGDGAAGLHGGDGADDEQRRRHPVDG
jgi:hypothetical protein